MDRAGGERLLPLFVTGEQFRTFLTLEYRKARARPRLPLDVGWNFQPKYTKRLMDAKVNIIAEAALKG